MTLTGHTAISALVAFAVLAFGDLALRADSIPAGSQAQNVKVVGYTGLNGRGGGAEKLAIKQVNGRWYLYTGHIWDRGFTIVDVTDPAQPNVVKFIPGPENTWEFQVDLHDNLLMTGLEKIGTGWGGDPGKPNEEGVLLWDIQDPANPKQLSHWKTGGGTGTHRNGYPGGRYAYLSANMPGYRGNILVILDVSDPRNPKEAGRWWKPGQKEGEQSSASYFFHGPAIVEGRTAYLGYADSVVILDVSDVARPTVVGELPVSPPFGLNGVAVHDVMKVPGRPLLLAHSESIAGDSPNATYAGGTSCDEPLPLVGMVDIKDPARPRLLSTFPVPVPPPGSPYTDFCDKGGRFGPHNTNLHYHSPDVEHRSDLIYLTYFNAGLRIFDIKDPRSPREVGWFVPPTPVKRYGPIPTKLVNQTEDVLVDARGNIYITDKQWGIFILRYTGGGERVTAQ